MDKQTEKVIKHIKDLENRLGYVDNNLRYIKVIQALKYWLEKFADLLSNNQALQREYQATYLSYFYTAFCFICFIVFPFHFRADKFHRGNFAF